MLINRALVFPGLVSCDVCLVYLTARHANVERLFSLINAEWSKERNRPRVESVKSLILTKYNIKMSCEAFHNYLLQNQDPLSKIGKITTTKFSFY